MPDVGILNLQIHDDSSKAAEGLNNLVTKLKEMKEATAGIKLGPVASGLKKINEALAKIDTSTVDKLNAITNALEKLSNAAGNVGGIKISFGGGKSQNLETLASQAQAAREAATQATSGFEELKSSVQEISAQDTAIARSTEDIQKANEQLDFSKFDPSKLPLGALGMQLSDSAKELWNWGDIAKKTFEDVQRLGSGGSFGAIGKAANDAVPSLSGVSEKVDEINHTVADVSTSAANATESAGSRIATLEQEIEELLNSTRGLGAALRGDLGQNSQNFAIQQIAQTWQTTTDHVRSVMADIQGTTQGVASEMGRASTAAGQLGASLQRDYGNELVDNLTNVYNEADLLQMRIDGLRHSLTYKINNNLVDEAQIAQGVSQIQNLQEKLENLNDTAAETKRSFSEIMFGSAGLGGAFKRMFPTISGLLSRFKQLVKYRMLRAVIKHITEGFKEGYENYYRYSEAIGSSFAPSMDNAASSLLQMKNSIGAAVAPLMQSLVPVLQSVVNWFINLVNYANQFLSLMRGQTSWSRAVPQSTKAFENQTKAAKKAGNAIKDLLADWDELNIIQSESGGSGTGTGAKAAENYLEMFEQVGTFDNKIKDIVGFIKDNFDDIKTIVMDIGAALLLWRFSNSFTGVLGQLASIVTIGVIFKLAGDAASFFDKKYIEEQGKSASWLFGDLIVTGALAGIAGKLASAQLGKSAGLITAGLVFAISAGATFSTVSGTQDAAKQKALTITGLVKAGLAAALVSAGFIGAGVAAGLSIVGGIAVVGLTIAITYSLKINAESAEKAKDFARRTFANTGKGGINATEYTEALQDEFNRITAGTALVLEAYVEVPDLKEKLTTAGEQISSFNQIVFSGDGKLTKEDAEAFKENWGIIIETLNTLNTKRYNTILAGVTDALNSRSAEIREKALHIRTSFLMIEKNISEENADIYQKMENITSKIANGTATDDDMREYEKYYKVFAAATETGMSEIDKALEAGKNIDFGDEKNAVENAKAFISTVGEAAQTARDEVEASRQAQLDSIAVQRRVEQAKFDNDLIDIDQYKERMGFFDELEDIVNKRADEKLGQINEKMQEAYDVVFSQALLTPGSKSEAYWEQVINPLLEEARNNGYKVPQLVAEAFADAVSQSNTDQSLLTPDVFLKMVKKKGYTKPSDIAWFLGMNIDAMTGKEVPEWVSQFGNTLGMSFNNNGMTPIQLKAQELIGISGWDLLSKEWKQYFIDSFRDAFGDNTTREILRELHVSEENIENYMKMPKGLAQATLFGAGGSNYNEGGFELFGEKEPTIEIAGIEPESVVLPIEVVPEVSITGDKNWANMYAEELNNYLTDPLKNITSDNMAYWEAGSGFRNAKIMKDLEDALLDIDWGDISINDLPNVSGNIATAPLAVIGMDTQEPPLFSLSGDENNSEQEINNTAHGVERGNAGMVTLLSSILAVAEAISQKDFTVNVNATSAPASLNATSALGRMMQQSENLYSKVTG